MGLFSREQAFPPIWDDEDCDELGELTELIDCPWIDIDNRYTIILNCAFEDVEGVEKISIASTIELIEEGAFWGCSVLKEICVDENNKKYKTIDGNLYSKDGKILIKYAGGKEENGFIVPNRVTHINNYAFEDADHLTRISIGDNVVSIGEQAFSSCRNLININISYKNPEYRSIEGVLYSKGGKELIAYPQGKAEKSFMPPESVMSINNYALNWARGLRDIFIGKNISFISEKAIDACGDLMNIKVVSDNPNYKSVEGVLYSKDGKKIIRYPQGKAGTSFVIPNGVTYIAENAFSFCKNLTNIIINKEIASIGRNAFWFCDNLKNIYYMGGKDDWVKISIDPFSYVIDLDIYYYSEIEITFHGREVAYKGKYWHYDADGETPVVWIRDKD